MKKILALICTAALLVSASGCNNSNADTNADATTSAPTEEATTTQAPVTEGEEEDVFTPGGDVTEKMIEISRLNEGNKARLAKVIKKAQNGEDITVAYIGGSITQGSSAGNDLCYAKLTSDWIQKQFPDIKVNYVNAGIGATGSYIGVYRADRDVLSKNPDLVFVEFSVNDTMENKERNINSYDSLLRKIWSYETAPAIICLGMTQEDGTSFAPHEEIAKSYDLPFISYKNAILHIINDKKFIVWDDISGDNIHPNVEGHRVLTELITTYISEAIENVADISETESDFSKAYTDDKYSSATLLTPDNITPTEIVGFTLEDDNFGNFGDYWRMITADGDYKGATLKFEAEFKTLGLFYGEIVRRGGTFKVIIDGEEKATIDAMFPNGWGNYVEAIEVATYDETAKRTVEIVPVNGTSVGQVNISALAIT